jgi:cold-inducible RNA-binding protein
MSAKVFVGNLPFSIDDNKLNEVFAQCGEIKEAVVIKNKFNGRSKGFGFVTFANDEDAKKAISEFNGKEVDGRALSVNEARPMEQSERRSDDRPRRSFGNDRRRF